MKKIDFRPQREPFVQLGKALNVSDWELCEKIRIGRNGVKELIFDMLEVSTLEHENMELTPFQKDLRKRVEITVPDNFAEKYDAQTSTRIGNQTSQRCFSGVLYWFLRNLEEYGQAGAVRRLQLRKKTLKDGNDGPKLNFEDMKEDEINDVSKT